MSTSLVGLQVGRNVLPTVSVSSCVVSSTIRLTLCGAITTGGALPLLKTVVLIIAGIFTLTIGIFSLLWPRGWWPPFMLSLGVTLSLASRMAYFSCVTLLVVKVLIVTIVVGRTLWYMLWTTLLALVLARFNILGVSIVIGCRLARLVVWVNLFRTRWAVSIWLVAVGFRALGAMA